VGFVVDKVALGQVFFEYCGFPRQFSFHRLLHTYNHLLSGAGTLGQLMADIPSGLSLTPPQETKNLNKCFHYFVHFLYISTRKRRLFVCCSVNVHLDLLIRRTNQGASDEGETKHVSEGCKTHAKPEGRI
jgi:hypothetical protein